MSRRQIEKDFYQLYVGQNQQLLVENYYKKKKRDMLLLFFVGGFLVVFLFLWELEIKKIQTGEGLERNDYGEGSREVELEVEKQEGDWEMITVLLAEKEYTRTEIEESCRKLEEELPQIILASNESLDMVKTDLYLPQEIEGYPLFLSWKSSKPEIISSSGSLVTKQLEETGEIVELTVNMEYGEWNQEHSFFVRVVPVWEVYGFIQEISDELKNREENSRQEKSFYLPSNLGNTILNWRYPMDSWFYLLGLLVPILLLIIWREKDREIHKKVKIREESLQRQYPEFISKLILFMEAGISAKGAIFRIVEDYQKKREKGKKSEYLYEELKYICWQMQNGMSELQGYELLGRRCQLPHYRKLSTLLIQHIQKGAGGMLMTLREESRRANEEQKAQVKRLGEEAGTKMLFPMMLMLGIVMILIIVPACFSFQV